MTRRRLTRRQRQQHLLADLYSIQVELGIVADWIDTLGDQAAQFLGPLTVGKLAVDQVACYASNSLQGTLSLLRELGSAIAAAPARKRRR